MKIRSILALAGALFALCTSAVAAPDKATQQADVRKAVQASLEKFYKAQPNLKKDVEGAPGYAVFTTYGLSFVIGGGGGTGLARDKAGKETFMNMGQASAGLQAGIGERDTLFVFKTKKAYDNFVTKGWEFGGAGQMSAGAGGKTAGGGSGEEFVSDALTYSLTKKGLEVGAGLAGSKYWKSKELN